MTNSSLTFRANDWRLSDRFAGFTLIGLHGEWLRGEWFTVTVALLGLRLTYTRWLVVPVESLGRDDFAGDAFLNRLSDGGWEKAP